MLSAPQHLNQLLCWHVQLASRTETQSLLHAAVAKQATLPLPYPSFLQPRSLYCFCLGKHCYGAKNAFSCPVQQGCNPILPAGRREGGGRESEERDQKPAAGRHKAAFSQWLRKVQSPRGDSALPQMPKTKAKGHVKQAEAAGNSLNAKQHKVRPKHISEQYLLFPVFKCFITGRKLNVRFQNQLKVNRKE